MNKTWRFVINQKDFLQKIINGDYIKRKRKLKEKPKENHVGDSIMDTKNQGRAGTGGKDKAWRKTGETKQDTGKGRLARGHRM